MAQFLVPSEQKAILPQNFLKFCIKEAAATK
jgi:hypothetical protein